MRKRLKDLLLFRRHLRSCPVSKDSSRHLFGVAEGEYSLGLLKPSNVWKVRTSDVHIGVRDVNGPVVDDLAVS